MKSFTTNLFYIRRFVICALFFAILSCGKSDRKSDLSVDEQDKDSILEWIAEGTNTELPYKKRRALLDKASKGIRENVPDTVKLMYYSKFSQAYLSLNDSFLFRVYNRKLERLAFDLDNDLELANSHWDLGSYFGKYAIRDSSFYHYYPAHTLMKGIGDNKSAGRLFYSHV